MGLFGEFKYTDKELEQEGLRINQNKGKVKAAITVLKFRDKETRQFIYYCPSFELSGYGATEEKAMEMLKFSVDQFLSFLIKLNQKQLHSELAKLGWKKNAFRNKEYSKLYIDVDGELQNFNAENVERLTLVA